MAGILISSVIRQIYFFRFIRLKIFSQPVSVHFKQLMQTFFLELLNKTLKYPKRIFVWSSVV